MNVFAVLLADRYGNVMPPILRPVMAAIGLAIVIGALILWTVNRKKLDQIEKGDDASVMAPPPGGTPWTCPRCGEVLQPQFVSCWKCGAGKDD
jgi:hypothetical protein